MSEATIYFDGLTEPKNPGGVMAWGYIIDLNGERSRGGGARPASPENTNNRAEYFALGVALKKLIEIAGEKKLSKLTIYGDSQLIVNQITGAWRCNLPHLRECRRRCVDLMAELIPLDQWDKSGSSIAWIPREKNAEADQASRDAYRGLTGQDPPDQNRNRARSR